MESREKILLAFLLIVSVACLVFLMDSAREKYEDNKLETRCYEYVNDRGCRDVDSNTRECWNVPRKVSIDCDVNVAKEVEDEN